MSWRPFAINQNEWKLPFAPIDEIRIGACAGATESLPLFFMDLSKRPLAVLSHFLALGIAGTNNTVTIERHGVSRQIEVDATDSEPREPAHTNTVTVI